MSHESPSSVNCPECRSRTHVLDSYGTRDGLAVRRRRRCLSCSHRFTTWETTNRATLVDDLLTELDTLHTKLRTLANRPIPRGTSRRRR